MNKAVSLLIPALAGLVIVAAIGVLTAFISVSDFYIWIILIIFAGILTGALIYFVNRQFFGKNPHRPSIRLLNLYSLPHIADIVIGILWLTGAFQPFSSAGIFVTTFFCVSLVGCVCSWLMLLFETARNGGTHKIVAFIGMALFATVLDAGASLVMIVTFPLGIFLIIPAAVGVGYALTCCCGEVSEKYGIPHLQLVLTSSISAAAVTFAVCVLSGAVFQTGWGAGLGLISQGACIVSATVILSALVCLWLQRKYGSQEKKEPQETPITFDETPSLEEYERIKDRL